MGISRRTLPVVLLAGLLLLLPVSGVASSPPLATVSHADGTLTVTPLVAYDHLSLRVATPDGRLFQAEGSGGAVHFSPFAIADYAPPDGTYVWELRLTPRGAISAEVIERARRARESGDVEAEQALSAAARRAMVIRSGGFHIVAGKLVMGDGTEGPARPRGQSRGTILSPFAPASVAEDDGLQLVDQVIPDDLIVQGSLCVGLDCVNNENFGFDTIRLKENNTRIKFEDTSVGTFPSNDWQLTANDSASGGLNKLSIEDVTGARVPFTILAGAPTNSLFMDSLGRVGLRTATPVLDLHANTTNTPAFRLEQNSGGGFTAQTWDVAGNEANFFVRDVTGGSRLPLRIRPGAPTSSLDIAFDGKVGLGTQSPSEKVHVFGGSPTSPNDANTLLLVANTTVGPTTAAVLRAQSDVGTVNFQAHASNRVIARFGQVLGGWTELLGVAGNGFALGTLGAAPIIIGTNNADRIHILANGNIGMGQPAPVHPLQMASGAHVTAGGVWTSVSSREAKDDIRSLTADEARTTLAALEPVKFAYKADPTERHVGFVAEDVPDLVAQKDRKTLSPMDIVAVLTRVVQEQQQRIEELTAKLAALEAARPR
jgi:Chaperone of endosialidase